MPEERYKAMMAQVHAGHGLIDRVLQPRTPRRSTPLRAAIAMACCLVMLTAAFVLLTPPPKDLVTPTEQTPLDGNAALAPLPSDELTISVSDVKLEDPYTLSMVITARGDKVDALTELYVDYPLNEYITGSGSLPLDTDVELQPNEVICRFSIETKKRPILEVLDNPLELSVWGYTSGTTQSETLHAIDWASQNYDLQNTGEPIIDFGGGLTLNGFGLSEEGWLITQTRWPVDSAAPTVVYTWLSPDGTNDDATNITMRIARQYGSGDYVYNEVTLPATRDELEGMYLVTYVRRNSEEIKGNWPFTVDLSHLTAD